jgi:hypothetical protein
MSYARIIGKGEALMKPSRQEIERVYEEQGYAAAKALAGKMGIIWFASAGARQRKADQ